MRPLRGFQRAARKNIAILSVMHEANLFILTGQYDLMVTNH